MKTKILSIITAALMSIIAVGCQHSTGPYPACSACEKEWEYLMSDTPGDMSVWMKTCR